MSRKTNIQDENYKLFSHRQLKIGHDHIIITANEEMIHSFKQFQETQKTNILTQKSEMNVIFSNNSG